MSDEEHPSMTQSGEDVMEEAGKDPGRVDTGTQGQSDRPVGESTPRDATGIRPEDGEPIDPESPYLPPA